MPSYSTNLNLTKPTVGGDTNQWGGYLNTNTDILDGIFNAAGTGTSVGLQVGSGKTLKVGGTLTATGTIQLTGSQNELRFFEAIGGADNYVALKAPNDAGGANYSLVLPASQGTAGQFLKLTSLSGTEGLLQFASVTTPADNYFATSGLSNKDLGVGLHLKTGDSGASSVSSSANQLVIEGSGDSGLSILSFNDSTGMIAFGDGQDNDVAKISYNHEESSLSFTSGGSINFVGGGSGIDLSVLSNGTVLVGSGSKISSELLNITSASDCAFFKTTSGGEEALTIWRQAANGTFISFLKTDGNACGSINNSSNGSVTTYATSSDYRLKENEISISDGIDRIKQLNPYRFNFKDNPNNDLDGFFAHEVQDIVPEAVVGEKDGEEMQGIDQAKLVPLITAALQEAITKIESLESEIDQLKGVN
jgi:hypothetical protein